MGTLFFTAFLYCAVAFLGLAIILIVSFMVTNSLGVIQITFFEKSVMWGVALMGLSALIFGALSIATTIFHLG